MPDVFLLKAIAKALLLPPTGLLLVALIGLAIIRRHPRTGRVLATAAVATLLALSMPIVAGSLVRLLDDSPPIDLAVAKTAQAIVIPGGGVRRNALEYGGDTLGRLTLERVRYGARLAKATGLPVLVTGGSVLGDTTPEAVLMKEALESEYGVTVRWVEDRSRNTRENAEFTARTAAAEACPVVLVAAQLRRAARRRDVHGRGTAASCAAPIGFREHQIDLPRTSSLGSRAGHQLLCLLRINGVSDRRSNEVAGNAQSTPSRITADRSTAVRMPSAAKPGCWRRYRCPRRPNWSRRSRSRCGTPCRRLTFRTSADAFGANFLRRRSAGDQARTR